MANLPTAQELSQFIDDTLRGQVDPNATGAYDNSAGSDNRAFINVLTKVGLQLYAYAADRKAASIGQTASGPDLDTVVEDVYFDERQDANASVGTVYLKRTGSMPATSIGQGSRFSTQATATTPSVVFEASGAVSWPISVASSQDRVAVPVQCLQQGAVGEVQLVAITQILDQLGDQNWFLYVPAPGDPVLGTKPAPDVIGGGQDQETDPQVKSRVLVRPAQAEPGTKAGVYKGATTVPGIASAVPVEPGDGTGLVFAGDQNFLLPSAMQQQVLTAMENWRAMGVPVGVKPFIVTTVQVTGTIYMQRDLSNYDQNALLNNAVNAVLDYFATGRSRPDEYYPDQISGAAGRANAETQSVVLSSPSGPQKRPADSSYGGASQMNRYVVTAASISFKLAGPQTL
jgi:hypothetical protein